MAHTQREALLRYLTHMVSASALAEESDRQLLDRFVRCREEVAFAALLRRHAGMVWHVCRRVLGHVQDAEDVFQATFLLLARKANSIRKQEAVASWLHGVAHRLSLRARLQADRRQARERQVSEMTRKEPGAEAAWRELQALLDEELHRLPEKYRAPLVLCYLEDKTHEQAAAQLGWPLGTVRGRVARAREMLRTRLARRGLALSAPALGTALAANVALAVPPRLLAPTLQAALQFAGGKVAAALVSSKAAALVEGGLKAMFLSKLKMVMALVVTAGVLASGAGALSQLAPGQNPAPAEVQKGQEALEKLKFQRQPAGLEPLRPGPSDDTLPPGALTRLGSDRLAQTGSFYCLSFAPDGKVMACAQMDSTIRLLEVPSGKELRRLGQPQTPDTAKRNYWVSQMTFSADGRLLAILKPNQEVTVWRADTGKELCKLSVDLRYEVASIALAPDGKTLATGGKELPPRLWDASTGKELRRFEGHQGPAPCVAFSPDGKQLATGGDDQTVRLWDVATGNELAQLAGHRNAVHAVAFSPDGKRLASAALDRTVRLWETATGQELQRLDASRGLASSGAIVFVSFSDDGKTVALGRNTQSDRTVRFWEVQSGVELKRFEGPTNDTTNVALSPDGRVVAMGSVHGRLHLWDRITGQELPTGEGHQYPVLTLAFSPDGTLLATGSMDRTIRLWDVATGRELRQMQGHMGDVSHLAFSSDGKLLASVSRDPNDRTLSVWDAATGKEVRQIRFQAAPAPAPQSRADERAGSRASDIQPGGGTSSGGGSSGTSGGSSASSVSVVALASVPNSQSIALLDSAGMITLWDMNTGKAIRTLPTRGATSMSFAPDGKSVAVSKGDGVLRLLDVSNGQEVRTFDGRPALRPPQAATVRRVIFSPDGRTLLGTTDDSRLLVWDAATGDLLRQISETGEALAAPASRPSGGGSGTSGAGGASGGSGTGGGTGSTGGGTGSTGASSLAPNTTGGGTAGRTTTGGSTAGGFTGGGTSGFGNSFTSGIGAVGMFPQTGGLGFVGTGGGVGVGLPGSTGGRSSRPASRSITAISPDGRMLVVLGKSNSVRLLEAATGKERGRFQGHQAEITAIAFSPDGKTLATASVDSTVLLWDVTSPGKEGRKTELPADELKTIWTDLLEGDAAKAYQGQRALIAAPKQTLPFLTEQLRPAAATETRQIPQLITDLDSEDFATRKKAVEELEKLGNLARPALLKTLAAKPSLEMTKRIEGLLKNTENQVPTGEVLRQLRAVEVLELIGTPEAREILGRLARGGASAPTTIDAAAALERLNRRK